MNRRIYLVSPREPCGATWLINCFLEMGIKTHRMHSHLSCPPMWLPLENSSVLSPHEYILKKWLPSLTDHRSFHFHLDIDVVWCHSWPEAVHAGHKVIYFIRDPRDAMYSRYRRENPDQSFHEFISFPDPLTLLDKIDCWRLFNLCWLEHRPMLEVFRFEDYKADAHLLLRRIVEYTGIDTSEADIDRAVSASTFERAAEAERNYRKEHPEDEQIINRSGQPGNWRELQGNDREVITEIEERCSGLLQLFGYVDSTDVPKDASLHQRDRVVAPPLDFFNTLIHRANLATVDAHSFLKRLETVEGNNLAATRLPPYELLQLIFSIAELYSKTGKELPEKFMQMYAELGDVSELHMRLFRLTGKLSHLASVKFQYLLQVVCSILWAAINRKRKI